MTPRSFADWRTHLDKAGPVMTDDQAEACARLAAVLLCGEQSAVQIFATEVRRGAAPRRALHALRVIEFEEQLHEQALRAFCNYLPAAADGHALRRRAQHFFLRLGRTDGVATHFSQIAHLDSAVCKIMHHVENSSIDRVSPLRRIAAQIKNDEARHVAVSRNYARLLGMPAKERNDYADTINDGLVEMLSPLADSFEIVGVDSDRLFNQIRSR
jgi:hypothetical protein